MTEVGIVIALGITAKFLLGIAGEVLVIAAGVWLGSHLWGRKWGRNG